MKNWRNSVSPLLKNHLELQINETLKQKKAYSKSRNKANAQLWCAVANLSKQIFDLNLKINYLESQFKKSLKKK